MAPVFAHANMRDGAPDRLAHTYQRELSQGVALQRVSVVKNTASVLYDWKKLSFGDRMVFRGGASRLRGLDEGFMHGPAALASVSVGT